MMKRIAILLVALITLYTLHYTLTYAQEGATRETEQKLEEVHNTLEEMRSTPDLVTPDSIYTTTQLKALYYQNIQIIQLLKQIRNLLQQQLEKEE